MKVLKTARFFATGSLPDIWKYTISPARMANAIHPIEKASEIKLPKIMTSYGYAGERIYSPLQL
jgi:hypothetical protein